MSLGVPLAFSPPAFCPSSFAPRSLSQGSSPSRGHHRGYSPSRDRCHGHWQHRANCVPLQPTPRTGQVQAESSSVSERDADTGIVEGTEIKLGRTRSRRPVLGAYMEANSMSSHFPPRPSSHRTDRARDYLALHGSCFMSAVVTCLITSRCVAWRFMDSIGRPWPSDVCCLFRRPLLPLSAALWPHTISVDGSNAVFNPPLCCVLTVVSRISTTLQF